LDKNKSERVILIDSCKSCGRVLKEEWRFCPYCNNQVEIITCPFCRKEIKVQWEYCPYCKTKVKGAYLVKKAFDDGNEWLRDILKK